jgi:cytochrome c5
VLEHTHADSAVLSGTGLVLRQACATVADLHLSGLPSDGAARLWVGRQADGSTAVTGVALPGSQALHVSTVPVLLG